MKIAILGLWHLGCVYAAGSASVGHKVSGHDLHGDIIKNLQQGKAPLFEPALDDVIKQNLNNGSLEFTENLHDSVNNAELVWITYDTPVDDQDRADCDFVIERVCEAIPHIQKNTCVLVSSQLPVGSIRKLEKAAQTLGRPDIAFACSPENLRLGNALEIFLNPDRVICGLRAGSPCRQILERLWAPITDNVIWMGVESAEMSKHAINAFLATSVAFANEIATICELTGADAKEVEQGLKTESRIGNKAYVGPGLAFAGGTLARDIRFLSDIAKEKSSSILFSAVWNSNNRHKNWVVDKLKSLFATQNLLGKKIALWGLAYKPGTSTLRRSSALEYAKALSEAGAELQAFDPAVKSIPASSMVQVQLCSTALDAAKGADALVLCTPWPDFLKISPLELLSVMRGNMVIDPARFLATLLYTPQFQYVAIGLGMEEK